MYLGADFTVHRIGPDGSAAVVAGGGGTAAAAQPGQLATTLKDVNLVAARGDAVYLGVGPYVHRLNDDGTLAAGVKVGDVQGVRRVDREGVIRTIMPDARAASLALDVQGNLYVTSDVSTDLQVIARPGEMEFSEPFPWLYVGIGVGALLLAAPGGFVLIRRKRKRDDGLRATPVR